MIFDFIRLQSGDKVILPNFICEVVIDAVINCGAIPVLADSEKDSPNISINSLAKLVDPDVKVIIASHTYGMSCRIDEIQKIASQHKIILIEDCAQAVGSTYNDSPLGSFGDFAIFSFNFDKPFSTGMGGALIINSAVYGADKNYFTTTFARTTIKQEKQILKALLLQSFLTEKENYKNFVPISFAARILNLIPVQSLINKSIRNRDTFFLKPISKYIKIYKMMYKLFKLFILKTRSAHKTQLMNKNRSFFALKQLAGLNDAINSRKNNADFYKMNLLKIQHPDELPKSSTVFTRYTVLCKSGKERDDKINLARSMQIELDHNNWQHTLSQISKYKKVVDSSNDYLLNSQDYANRLLHLPTHPFVTNDDLQMIKTIIDS